MGKLIIVLMAALLIFGIIKLIPGIFAALGNNAYSNGDKEKAVSFYKKAAEFGGGTANNKMMYALLLMRIGSFNDAERILNGVILYSGAKPAEKHMAKAYRAMLYSKTGRLDDALEDAEETFESFKNTTTYGMLGYLRQLKGIDSLNFCIEAYEYNSDDRDICDNLVAAYISAGKYDEAEKLTDKLRAEFPEFVEGFYHSAVIALKKGDKDSAAEYLDKIAECNRTEMTTVSEEEIKNLREEIKNA